MKSGLFSPSTKQILMSEFSERVERRLPNRLKKSITALSTIVGRLMIASDVKASRGVRINSNALIAID
jgi:hypothetical protein